MRQCRQASFSYDSSAQEIPSELGGQEEDQQSEDGMFSDGFSYKKSSKKDCSEIFKYPEMNAIRVI